MTKRIITTARVLPDGQPFKLIGRYGWALKNLVAAGKRGCTLIDHPGPRWSAYAFQSPSGSTGSRRKHEISPRPKSPDWRNHRTPQR